jgi:hypothetical protein
MFVMDTQCVFWEVTIFYQTTFWGLHSGVNVMIPVL